MSSLFLKVRNMLLPLTTIKKYDPKNHLGLKKSKRLPAVQMDHSQLWQEFPHLPLFLRI